GEEAGEERTVELHEVRQSLLEREAQRLAHGGVVVPDARHAESRDTVEVPPAVTVVQVAALGARVDLVVSDQARDARPGRVDVLRVKLVVLAEPPAEEIDDVDGHEGLSLESAGGRVNRAGPRLL